MQKYGPKCPKCSRGCPKNGGSCFREKYVTVLRGCNILQTFCRMSQKRGNVFPGKKLLPF